MTVTKYTQLVEMQMGAHATFLSYIKIYGMQIVPKLIPIFHGVLLSPTSVLRGCGASAQHMTVTKYTQLVEMQMGAHATFLSYIKIYGMQIVPKLIPIFHGVLLSPTSVLRGCGASAQHMTVTKYTQLVEMQMGAHATFLSYIKIYGMQIVPKLIPIFHGVLLSPTSVLRGCGASAQHMTVTKYTQLVEMQMGAHATFLSYIKIYGMQIVPKLIPIFHGVLLSPTSVLRGCGASAQHMTVTKYTQWVEMQMGAHATFLSYIKIYGMQIVPKLIPIFHGVLLSPTSVLRGCGASAQHMTVTKYTQLVEMQMGAHATFLSYIKIYGIQIVPKLIPIFHGVLLSPTSVLRGCGASAQHMTVTKYTQLVEMQMGAHATFLSDIKINGMQIVPTLIPIVYGVLLSPTSVLRGCGASAKNSNKQHL
ncbi:uncharacterized protein [Misgurnus anguillicaudatus]|uniref:uncharacterized protein n=1 Tax=Misgurnus anguillicaudatus TaxID=75329 RepID=UPI003CCF2202